MCVVGLGLAEPVKISSIISYYSSCFLIQGGRIPPDPPLYWGDTPQAPLEGPPIHNINTYSVNVIGGY